MCGWLALPAWLLCTECSVHWWPCRVIADRSHRKEAQSSHPRSAPLKEQSCNTLQNLAPCLYQEEMPEDFEGPRTLLLAGPSIGVGDALASFVAKFANSAALLTLRFGPNFLASCCRTLRIVKQIYPLSAQSLRIL